MAAAAMNNFLQNVLGVNNQHMRQGLQGAGFNTLNTLVRQNPVDYARRCCDVVRKGPGNQPARKNVPVTVEVGMKQLIIYCMSSTAPSLVGHLTLLMLPKTILSLFRSGMMSVQSTVPRIIMGWHHSLTLST